MNMAAAGAVETALSRLEAIANLEPVHLPASLESIAVRTTDGFVELVPRGVEVPSPGDAQWARIEALTAPQSLAVGSLELRIELVIGADRRPFETQTWELFAPVVAGESLHVDVCFDEDEGLQLSLSGDRCGDLRRVANATAGTLPAARRVRNGEHGWTG